ncbi:UbiD family decarboxylase [Govanella unica]|uniref:UbiD family decarboxylase n=1 Tax=Govanella unica TaxID=2975056 RepID=A0A9X3U099_9PROT|nr:UbiD family decarboxylase [Govania unica]MDA5194995.1 UbiD family decarboxylase [Govania unica]
MKHWIEDIAKAGDLLQVSRKVDPRHELAAVVKAIQKDGEKAVRFARVAGSQMPVVSNLYGSHKRLCDLIQAPEDGFCKTWTDLTANAARDWRDCVEIIDRPQGLTHGKMSDLPQITYHGKDAGPYVTSAIYISKEPDSGVPNLSFHRSMMVSDDELRIRLGSSHDMARFQAKAEGRDEPLEAALLIGVAPEIFLSACSSPPYNVSELGLAVGITGQAVRMYPARHIDMLIPETTQIVVEGRIIPNVRRPEGPFGEFMGNYVPVGDNHVFEVLDVYWQPDAIFHALLCGSPEDLRPLEAVTAARIYKHITSVVPGVLDVSCRPNVMITIIRIDKQYEGHGQHVLLAALGSHLDYNKVCIVVDKDVDIYDLDDVMWAYLTRGRADTRAQVLRDIPGFYRDPQKDHWGRLIIDATMPWGREEEFQRKTIPGEESIDLAAYLDGT